MNITADYDDIMTDIDKRKFTKRRKELLNIQRPLTIDENKEFDKLSYLLLLQKEITEQKRKRKSLIKYYSNKDIVVV